MKKLIITILMSASILASYAQEGRSNIDKIEHLKAQKVAFMTQQIDLTSEEAQKFWPVYNEWEKQLGFVSAKRDRYEGQMKRALASPTPNVAPYLDSYVQTFQEEQNLRNSYHAKFCAILSKEKVAKLYMAEERFQNKLLREWMEQHINERTEKEKSRK